MKQILCITALFCLVAPLASAEPTYAERLGWPEGARVLMIHADDFGMSHASNVGTIATLEAGAVTSASIMMPCSWVPGAVAYLKEHPETCVGLHLTLTAEWDPYRWGPVAGREAVPGLVNAEGFLHDNVKEVVDHATPDEVEREIRAQIALAESMGIRISHIDSHMGTLFATPEYFERFMKVGIEKQIPILIAGGHLTQASKEDAAAMDLIRQIVPEVWKAGLPVLDDIDTRSYSWRTTDKKAEFIDMIRTLKPGVTWFNVHPTAPTEEAKAITNNRELLWGDYNALIDPEIKKVIEEEGVILTTWRELKERRDRAEK